MRSTLSDDFDVHDTYQIHINICVYREHLSKLVLSFEPNILLKINTQKIYWNQTYSKIIPRLTVHVHIYWISYHFRIFFFLTVSNFTAAVQLIHAWLTCYRMLRENYEIDIRKNPASAANCLDLKTSQACRMNMMIISQLKSPISMLIT